MSYFDSMNISSSSLEAQRMRMEAAAVNMANADSSAPVGGQVFQVRRVRQEENTSPEGSPLGVRYQLDKLDLPARLEHDPSHPDADAQGMVHYPDVDLIGEMSQLMAARRSYQAGLSAYSEARTMFLKALEIGRA